MVRRRLSRSTRGMCQAKEYPENMMANNCHQNERQTMHLLFSPVLASALYIGGGSVGLILLIVVVVLLLRG